MRLPTKRLNKFIMAISNQDRNNSFIKHPTLLFHVWWEYLIAFSLGACDILLSRFLCRWFRVRRGFPLFKMLKQFLLVCGRRWFRPCNLFLRGARLEFLWCWVVLCNKLVHFELALATGIVHKPDLAKDWALLPTLWKTHTNIKSAKNLNF